MTADDDPNIELFKIYQWIMTSDISSLLLTSALSMNASSIKMKSLIDNKLAETKKDKPYIIEKEIDKNMTICDTPSIFTVGTSYQYHPPYPRLGHRVIHISNCSKLSSN